MTDTNPHHRTIRSFVRREGRFTNAQKQAFEDLWPVYGLSKQEQPFQFTQVFGNDQPVILEIGFGNGASLAQMIGENTDKNYLGIEVHRPGVGSLMKRLHEQESDNVRIICDDAVEVLKSCIADNSLHGIQVFFPDPWPKKKHHKRRLIQTELVALLQKKLKPGGILHLATDWQDYANHMMETITPMQGWDNLAGKAQFSPRPSHRPLTKYESRGQRLGHGVWDLLFKKV